MLRKNARSSADSFSRLRIHDGNAPLAVIAQPAAQITSIAAPQQSRTLGGKSRNDFNVHPLRAHVVRNVFRGDGEAISSRNGLPGNDDLPGIKAGLGIPFETDGS